MLALVVVHGSQVGRCLRPEAKGSIIGRGAASDIVLDVKGLSRTHARIVFDGGVWWIEDLNSTNGVWLNRSRVDKAPLHSGDVLQLSDMMIVCREVEDGPKGGDGWFNPPGGSDPSGGATAESRVWAERSRPPIA